MTNIRDTFLTGAMYAPFCRTKHAPIEEWDADMQKMAQLGYTCLHGFAEWHDIEYEKGHFDFSKIDYFIETAVKNGLVPIVNVATQNSVGFYSPRWFMEEYRGVGEGMVDSLGQKLMQEEYVIPCMDDPLYQAYATRYLKALACHFAGDERIGGFVLWGEPMLFSPRNGGTEICYCRHTKAKFRRWLREKYKTIDALNALWGNEGPSDYVDFDQINPPTGYGRQLGGFHSWEDWREYMEQNLADHIKAADRIFKENGALQPTITEMLPGINNGVDVWKLSDTTDIVGISLFGKPTRQTALYMTVADSVAKAHNRSTFVIEAGGGSIKFDDPNPLASAGFTPSAEELKTAMLMRAGYGTKGLMFWCWRPRLSDTEGNDFGMCRPDGKPLKRAVQVGEFAKRMAALSSVYNGAKRKSEVAVYMSQQINHIMAGDKMTDNYLNALTGANFILTDLHINMDFICEKGIVDGLLTQYKVLVLPCTYIISEECAQKIAEFVKAGGHVIADYILAEKRPGGLCYTALPGAGFDEVFGIEREDVLHISHPTMERSNSLGIETGSMVEELIPKNARVIGGDYMPGYPLLTENRFGSGRAVYIATQFFSKYAVKPDAPQRTVLADMLEKAGVLPCLALEQEDRLPQSALVTSSMQDDNGGLTLVTVTNTGYDTITDTLVLPDGEYAFVEEKAGCLIERIKDQVKVSFTLGAMESMALYR